MTILNGLLARKRSWLLDITMRLISGYEPLDKYGKNPLITAGSDPEDVWDGGGIYNYDPPGTAPIQSLVSTDAGDTQTISILGLDITGAQVSQDITLSGTTRVDLTTALWRVYRMQNDGTIDIAGTVTCYTGTAATPDTTTQRAIIEGANNQTLMALYTVPLGKVGFLFRGEVGMEYTGSRPAASETAALNYMSRRVGKVFKVKKAISLISNGNSNYADRRVFPDIIPALTDVKMNVETVTDDMGIWGTFDMLIVDENKLSKVVLAAIGQPSEMPS